MKPTRYFYALTLSTSLIVTGCGTLHHSAGAQQQKRADRLAEEYLDCVVTLIHKTAREKYEDRITRRNVVLDSCQSSITPFTIVKEQVYNDICLANGQNSAICDTEAVDKAARDAKKLQQRAINKIDAAPMPYNY